MESSDLMRSQSLLDISNVPTSLPGHHAYLKELVQAESFFTSSNYDYNLQHSQSNRGLESILNSSSSTFIREIYSELDASGVSPQVSEYILKLISGLIINNYRKYKGPFDCKVNNFLSDISRDSHWIEEVLIGYNISPTVSGKIIRNIIAHAITEYGNNFSSFSISDWSCWEKLSDDLSSSPSVCFSQNGNLHVFYRDNHKHLCHKYKHNEKWSICIDLGITIASAPSSVSSVSNVIHVFALAYNHSLIHLEISDNSVFFEEIHGNIISAPFAYCNAKGDLHVFARGFDDSLHHIVKSTIGTWTNWQSEGGKLTSAPAAVSWDDNRIDVFARGFNCSLLHIYCTDDIWSSWENLGGYLTSAPCCSSRTQNRIDLFARGANNQLIWMLWNGVEWTSWKDIGGFITSRPSSVSFSPDRIDVFAKGANNELIFISNS